MGYDSLGACVADLERNGHLVRVKEEVDPFLEMAAIHVRVFERQGPALFFENIKGSKYAAVSNLFGTLERSKFMFRDTLEKIQLLVDLKSHPMNALKNPFRYAPAATSVFSSLPRKVSPRAIRGFSQIQISDIPQIVNWPNDGGPFVTMPQVYTEDVDQLGIMHANLGMYRLQLAGNEYIKDQEIGLHYQLHRGIGVHQTRSNAAGKALKVSIFIGGPPAHPLAAVMPLPEGLSEMTFAGALANKRFKYFYDDQGFCVSADADFIITGTVAPHENKPEGPFGDHLGYYSLKHPFPLLKVHRVYARKDAIWSFTVVGRPPQEDTSFGALIHEMTKNALPDEIPGLKEVNAVDAAGVHPLLFAIGSERYTPYSLETRPQEILTIANHILGKSQLSLAKYLWIAASSDDPRLTTHNEQQFLAHILERIDFSRDIHFHTRTTMDTLDYSGDGLNAGSKVVLAAAGPRRRVLATEYPGGFEGLPPFAEWRMAMPGVLAVSGTSFESQPLAEREIAAFAQGMEIHLRQNNSGTGEFALIVICDDSAFAAKNINNFLWITFTRSNPSHDIYGIGETTVHKHWGCTGPLIIDARIKPHHAPVLKGDPQVEKRVDQLGVNGHSLQGII